nr:DUF3265 domain-containing protein [Photobacterium salinisoli]
MGLGLKSVHRCERTTKHLSVIRNAWRFWYAVAFVFTVQCGNLCIALLTP